MKSALGQHGSRPGSVRQFPRVSNKTDIVLQSIENSAQIVDTRRMTESEERSGGINENSNDSQEV